MFNVETPIDAARRSRSPHMQQLPCHTRHWKPNVGFNRFSPLSHSPCVAMEVLGQLKFVLFSFFPDQFFLKLPAAHAGLTRMRCMFAVTT
jgi:hypothetical protein